MQTWHIMQMFVLLTSLEDVIRWSIAHKKSRYNFPKSRWKVLRSKGWIDTPEGIRVAKRVHRKTNDQFGETIQNRLCKLSSFWGRSLVTNPENPQDTISFSTFKLLFKEAWKVARAVKRNAKATGRREFMSLPHAIIPSDGLMPADAATGRNAAYIRRKSKRKSF